MSSQQRFPPTVRFPPAAERAIGEMRSMLARTWKRLNFRSFLWTCLVLPCLGVIYWMVNSQGARMKMPVLAIRLWKIPIPGFSHLRGWEGLRQIDLAHIFAMFLLFATWYLSCKVLTALLFDEVGHNPDTDAVVYRRIVYVLAGIIIPLDVVLFFYGVAEQGGWGGGGFVPVFAAIAYAGVLGFCAFVHVNLKNN